MHIGLQVSSDRGFLQSASARANDVMKVSYTFYIPTMKHWDGKIYATSWMMVDTVLMMMTWFDRRSFPMGQFSMHASNRKSISSTSRSETPDLAKASRFLLMCLEDLRPSAFVRALVAEI